MSERRRLCITKRACIALMLFVLAGAIVNVAVAWGCAMLIPLPDQSELGVVENFRSVNTLTVQRRSRPGAQRLFFFYFGPGSQVTNIEHAPALTLIPRWALHNLRPPESQVIDSRGIPCLAVWCEYREDGATGLLSRGGFAVSSRSLHSLDDIWNSQILPLRPIWPGFAINTVFYAGILWGLFALPAALRRKRRLQLGLCPKCAYPVGINAVCTECGAAVTAKPQRGASSPAQGDALGIDHATTPPPKP